MRPLLLSLVFIFQLGLHPAVTPLVYAENTEVDAFNETTFPDGRVRPWYADALLHWERMTRSQREKFRAQTQADFLTRNALNPLPRILLESEYRELKAGVDQRAKAIQLFLEDHYSGKKSYRDTLIPGQIVDELLDRTGERAMEPYLKNKSARKFRYLFGPDVIRDSTGTWRVLEDNLGYVGGPGDLLRARETFELRNEKVAGMLNPVNDPTTFYDQLIGRFHDTASPRIGEKGGAFVVYAIGPYGDEEEHDLHEILKRRGATLVTKNTKDRKLVTKPDGVYLEMYHPSGRLKSSKKVGFVYLNVEHTNFEWMHPAIREKALLEEATTKLDDPAVGKRKRSRILKALERNPETRALDLVELESAIQAAGGSYTRAASPRQKSPVPGLFEAILEGKVQTNYTPGMEFVGDKMFHSYMEDLIRFYLNEEPILRNAESSRFVNLKDGEQEFNEKLLQEVLKNRDKWVLKTVDGRGGDGVWVGPKTKYKEWKKVLEQIREQPSRYIAQKYTHLSILGDSIVDLRVVSYVDESGKFIITNTPWGRSIQMKGGDGKVNLSLHGSETAVYVVEDPPHGAGCNGQFGRIAGN